ncbi:MAG: cation transporter [Deltaproteobacteria bacterium]|nr:cation transporter [Deltaproteobacteria bacterium]
MGYCKRSGEADGNRLHDVGIVLWVILFLNVAVALAKLLYGLAIHSVAMQADGFHSLFDGTSNVVGLIGMRMAGRPADRDHPYGHAKYETYASAAIGAMLLLAAWRVGSAALARLLDGGIAPSVNASAFGVMGVTLAVNLFVTAYERRRGRELRSEILLADASHTSSDILVSLGVVAGLVAVKLGYSKADPVIALLVAVAIGWAAWQVFQQASETFSDTARLPAETVCAVALGVPGVLGCHSIRTRGLASEVHVDLHIQVDPKATVQAGHAVAEAVERQVCERFAEVSDVIVHLEPLDAYQARKTEEERRRAESEPE